MRRVLQLADDHLRERDPLLQLGELLSVDQDVAAAGVTSSREGRRGHQACVTDTYTADSTSQITSSMTRQPMASRLPMAFGLRDLPRRSTATLKPTLWSVATILFSGLVAGQAMRVVDRGAGAVPRLVVEQQQPADAMGTFGWSQVDPIPRQTFEALLVNSGVVH